MLRGKYHPCLPIPRVKAIPKHMAGQGVNCISAVKVNHSTGFEVKMIPQLNKRIEKSHSDDGLESFSTTKFQP